MRIEIDGQACDKGFEDGGQGKALLSCPYATGTTQSLSWVSGYIEGKAVRNGYSVTRAGDRQMARSAAERCAVPLRSTAPRSAAEVFPERGVNIGRR
jgi:ribosome modulation factor